MILELCIAFLDELRLVAGLALKFSVLGLIDIGRLRLYFHLSDIMNYIGLLVTLVVLGLGGKGDVLGLVLIILVNECRLIGGGGVSWGRFGEGGLVA